MQSTCHAVCAGGFEIICITCPEITVAAVILRNKKAQNNDEVACRTELDRLEPGPDLGSTPSMHDGPHLDAAPGTNPELGHRQRRVERHAIKAEAEPGQVGLCMASGNRVRNAHC